MLLSARRANIAPQRNMQVSAIMTGSDRKRFRPSEASALVIILFPKEFCSTDGWGKHLVTRGAPMTISPEDIFPRVKPPPGNAFAVHPLPLPGPLWTPLRQEVAESMVSRKSDGAP